MNATTHRESAMIYQFPTHVRRPSMHHRDGGSAVIARLPQRTSDAIYDECWYHQAAIDETNAKPKI